MIPSNKTFKLTEEQGMILESAYAFSRDNSNSKTVRELIKTSLGYNEDLWKEITQLGWTGLTLPEEFGGSDLGIDSAVPICEAMGETLFATPLLSTLLASELLLASGNESAKAKYLPQVASGELISTVALSEDHGSWLVEDIECTLSENNGKHSLNGSKTNVLYAKNAGVILVLCKYEGNLSLVLIDQSAHESPNIEREIVIDESQRSFRLTFDNLSVSPEQILSTSASASFERFEKAAWLLWSAEMVGACNGVIKLTTAYLKTRKQFGKLIGSYQGLKHKMVELLADYESARSLLYHAVSLSQEDSNEPVTIIRMCKALISDCFTDAADRAIQFHGGFGFTYDCDAQLYLRRARFSEFTFGDGMHHRKHLANLLLSN